MTKETSDETWVVFRSAAAAIGVAFLLGYLLLAAPAASQEVCVGQTKIEHIDDSESVGFILQDTIKRSAIEEMAQQGILPPNPPEYIQEVLLWSHSSGSYTISFVGQGCYHGFNSITPAQYENIRDYRGVAL